LISTARFKLHKSVPRISKLKPWPMAQLMPNRAACFGEGRRATNVETAAM
jgi:hypothetical protein